MSTHTHTHTHARGKKKSNNNNQKNKTQRRRQRKPWPWGINKNPYFHYSHLSVYPGKSLLGNLQFLLLYSDKYNRKRKSQNLFSSCYLSSRHDLGVFWFVFCFGWFVRWVFLLSLLHPVISTIFLSDRCLGDFPPSFSFALTSSYHFCTRKRSNRTAPGRQKC